MLTSIVPELDIPLESIRLSAEVVASLLPKFMRWWMLSVICWLLLSRQDDTPSILKPVTF